MRLAEEGQVLQSSVPYDSQGGAQAGDWISMKNYNHLTYIISRNAGTGTDNLVVTLDQSTDVANSLSDSQTLNITEWYEKTGTQTGVGTFTHHTQTAADGFTSDNPTTASLYVIEIDRAMLDVDDGFDCVSLAIADTGSAGAQLTSVIAVLSEARYPGGGLTAIA